MKAGQMKQINFMMDTATIEATDRMITEAKRAGGKTFASWKVLHMALCAVEAAAGRMEMRLPLLEPGEEMPEALCEWIIQAEKASRTLAKIHTSTTNGWNP